MSQTTVQADEMNPCSEHQQVKQPYNNEINCRRSCAETRYRNDNNIFKCNDPCTKTMEKQVARTMTFLKNWPKHTKATPREIALAGFFYLGLRDRVKCFYCDGGLQNWQREDEPWFEHAKWYPNCEYLLKMKGIEYVTKVAAQFPHITRPLSFQAGRRPQSSLTPPHTAAPASPHVAVAADNTGSWCSSQNGTPAICHRLKAAMQSDVVREAQNFGFTLKDIEKLVKRKLENTNEEYRSVMQLVSDLQSFEELDDVKMVDDHHFEETAVNRDVFESPPQNSAQMPAGLVLMSAYPESKKVVCKRSPLQRSPMSMQVSPSVADECAMKIEFDSMKREELCEVCLDKSYNCVFVDCGHACCCKECASSLKICPICRAKISQIFVFSKNV